MKKGDLFLLTIESIAVSQVGKVREHNEDSLHVDDTNGLWLVADGMGGHASGEVASDIAVTVIPDKIKAKGTLSEAITFAHQTILLQGQQHPEQKGMGTTIVAAQSLTNGFNIAWVGDSRIYCFDNKLKQLTIDHTFVQDMIYREVLTPEEAENHPNSNLINRCMGMENKRFSVDSKKILPKHDGYLLLCSDGVSDYVSASELALIFKKNKSLQNIASSLENAVLNSDAADNFSFIILKYKASFLLKLLNCFNLRRK